MCLGTVGVSRGAGTPPVWRVVRVVRDRMTGEDVLGPGAAPEIVLSEQARTNDALPSWERSVTPPHDARLTLSVYDGRGSVARWHGQGPQRPFARASIERAAASRSAAIPSEPSRPDAVGHESTIAPGAPLLRSSIPSPILRYPIVTASQMCRMS
jgi:hypothetical protein